MKRAIKIGLLFVLVFAAGIALALTVTLTGPTDYTSTQWRSVCISNKTNGGQYIANIEVCPSTSDPQAPGACSTSSRSVASLPTQAQTIVNYMINIWRTDHPGF
jgi:hypothetical protein